MILQILNEGDVYYNIMVEAYSKIYNNIVSKGKYKKEPKLLLQPIINAANDSSYLEDIIRGKYYICPQPDGRRAQMLVEGDNMYVEGKARMVFLEFEDGSKYICKTTQKDSIPVSLYNCPPMLLDGYYNEVDGSYTIVDMYYGPSSVEPYQLGASFPMIGPKVWGKWPYWKRYEIIKKMLAKSPIVGQSNDLYTFPINYAAEVLRMESEFKELMRGDNFLFVPYVSGCNKMYLVGKNKLVSLKLYFSGGPKGDAYYMELFGKLGPRYEARCILHGYSKFDNLGVALKTKRFSNIKTEILGIKNNCILQNVFTESPDDNEILEIQSSDGYISRYAILGTNKIPLGTKYVTVMNTVNVPINKLYVDAEYCDNNTSISIITYTQNYFTNNVTKGVFVYKSKYEIDISRGCPSILWVVCVTRYGSSAKGEKDAKEAHDQYPSYRYEIKYVPGYNEKRSLQYCALTQKIQDIQLVNQTYGLSARNYWELNMQITKRIDILSTMPNDYVVMDYMRALTWLLSQSA
jgi:hypothetical protein